MLKLTRLAVLAVYWIGGLGKSKLMKKKSCHCYLVIWDFNCLPCDTNLLARDIDVLWVVHCNPRVCAFLRDVRWLGPLG